jgi:hypothetical protein
VQSLRESKAICIGQSLTGKRIFFFLWTIKLLGISPGWLALTRSRDAAASKSRNGTNRRTVTVGVAHPALARSHYAGAPRTQRERQINPGATIPSYHKQCTPASSQ